MKLGKMRRFVFARHCHPVSAWSRLLTTPLLLAPFWTRRPAVIAGVATWFAVNPVMTPEPAHQRAFATRAMLGEELWSTDPAQDRALVGLNAAGSVALAVAIIAAWRRRSVPAALSTAASMAITMASWKRYAEIFDRHTG